MGFLTIAEKIKMSEMYEEWQKANGLFDEPFLVIGFLYNRNWLDVDKILGDLNAEEEQDAD